MALSIQKYYLTKNRCYQRGVTCTKIGIQIHTIGTGQDDAKSVADYWNQPAVSACVHYCVDAATPGRVLQFLPESIRSWADAGYGNNNLITIEICESDAIRYLEGDRYEILDQKRFEEDILRGYDTAVELCAKICRERGWQPWTKLPSGLYLISSHDEGRGAGLSSAHVDPTHIWNRMGLSMDGFRQAVGKAMCPQFEIGADYRMRIDLSLRTEPRWDASGVLYEAIPQGRRQFYKSNAAGVALIKKGTVDRCFAQKEIPGRGTYMQITRGWILAELGDAERVIKK